MNRTLNGLFILLLACAGRIAGADAPPSPRAVTVEWLFGDGPQAVEAVPHNCWRPDGCCLLLDPRTPEAGRVMERLDPRTLGRTPAMDQKAALASLRAFLPAADVPAALPWPLGFSSSAGRALYAFGDRLLALDLPTARFLPATPPGTPVQAPLLSPDGRRVAYVRHHDLYVYDLENQTERRLTADGSDTVLNGQFSWVYAEEIFGHRPAAFWWSDDSAGLAFLRTDEAPVSTMSFMDFQPDQPRVLTQRYPKAGQNAPRVRVGLADAASGRTRWAALPDGFEYVARVTWLPGGARVAVQTMNRAQTRVDLHLVDRRTGRAQTVLTETDDDWVHIYEPVFLPEGRQFLWISDRSGYAHIYRYRLDGQLVNAVTAGEWSVRPFGAMATTDPPAIAAVDGRNGWVYFTAGEKSALERQLYRVRLDGTGMERLSPGDGSHQASFSPDARFYLDRHSSQASPPALTLHAADGKRLAELAAPRTDLLKEFDFQYPSLFRIPADDGFPLPAQLSRPAAFDPQRRHPVILYVYGGPSMPTVTDTWNGNDWSQSVYFDQVLLQEGYVVMSVDNRVSASVGAKFEKSMRGQMYGDVELGDLLAAVRWLKAQPWVDPDRIGIWGWSGGGMYTLLALTRSKEFKAGISVAPVTDWHYYDAKWTELPMKRPEDNPAGYGKTSLVKRAADLHGRLLLVYGTYDDNVHPQNSHAFMNGLIEAGFLFDLMVYPMRKHVIDDPPARIHLFKTMVAFWRKNL